jgi:hypothetical protein
MTSFHRATLGLLLVGLLTMHSVASSAADRIGVAASTKPNADGITSGNSQTLSPGSEVYANETVRTGNLGEADLVFVDQTNLTVGPTSEVVLDTFVYDPTGSRGNVVFQATRGAFLLVTGTQDHRAYAVNTPYGSLGDPPIAQSLDNFNREFQALDREARTILQPPLDEQNVPHGADGALMSYSPDQNENTRGQYENTRGQYESTGGAGGGVVEVVVAEKGKKLRPDECATKIRLVSGQADFTTTAGKKAHLREPNQTVCISANGSISYGSSTTSILGFVVLAQQAPPPSIGTTPISPPGVTPPTTPPCTSGVCAH